MKEFLGSEIKENKDRSEQFIRADMRDRLNFLEAKMEDKIKAFTIINCAAWIDLLYENNPSFFVNPLQKKIKNIRKEFARLRYGIDITQQILRDSQHLRGTHKKQLKKYLDLDNV